MAKTRKQKEVQVAAYSEKLKDYPTFYVVKPLGVNPNESVSIKKELFGVDGAYNVVKNSLFKIALTQEKLPGGELFVNGEYAVVFSKDQISESAKVIAKFTKETQKMEIVGGLLNGKVISADQVQALADLPSKDVLIAQLLSTFNGPMRNLVGVMQGNIREFTYVLNAIKELKETAA